MFFFLEFTDSNGTAKSLRFHTWGGRSSYLQTLRNVQNVRAYQRAE